MKRLMNFINDNRVVLICLFVYSLLVYGYAGVNTIINLDGIDDFIIVNKVSDYSLYLSVGRWGWSIIGLIFNYYPQPFICLLLNSVLFSLSGVYIGKIFNIKNKTFNVIISMIMIAFPSNILAYTYLPWEYSIGLGYFLSIYSVYLISNYKNIKSLLLSSFLLSFVTGIYQIFLELVIVICVAKLVDYYINNKEFKKIFKKALLLLLYIILGIVFYYIIVKISTLVFNVEMNSYQDAKNMFSIDFKSIVINIIPTLLLHFNITFSYFFENYVHVILKLCVIITLIFGIFNLKPKQWTIYILLVLLLIISPIIMNILKPYVWYHSLTLIPYSMFYTCGLCLLINFLKIIKNKKYYRYINKFLLVILSICSLNMLINANKALIMAKNSTDASFYYLNRLQTRIEMLDGYNDLPIEKKYFIYKRNYSSLSSFPFSNNAYVKEQGVTWTVLNGNTDIVSAMNLLGENVIEAELSKEDNDNIMYEINSRKSYPEEEGLFIYNDIVVIILDFRGNI